MARKQQGNERLRVVGVVLSPYARPGETAEVDGGNPVVQRYLSSGVLVREDDVEPGDDGGEREPAPAQQEEPGQDTKGDGQ